MRNVHKLLAMCLTLAFLAPLTGCTGNLFWNMWVGFGEAIGAIPGNAIGVLIGDLLAGIGIPIV